MTPTTRRGTAGTPLVQALGAGGAGGLLLSILLLFLSACASGPPPIPPDQIATIPESDLLAQWMQHTDTFAFPHDPVAAGWTSREAYLDALRYEILDRFKDEIPAGHRGAIDAGRIQEGFSMVEVALAWGGPNQPEQRTTSPYGTVVRWEWRLPHAHWREATFRDGSLLWWSDRESP